MTKAHVCRFLIGFGGGIAALALLLTTHPFALAASLALPVFLLSSLLAERTFRRLATPDAIKRDLEDRVRNPPS
jgi:hypothetical protein